MPTSGRRSSQRGEPSGDVGITRWRPAIVSFSMREGVKMAGATSRVSRVLMTGPLAPFAEAYRHELRERGYTERSAVNQLRQVARFSFWLQASQLSVPELSADRVEEFLGWQRACGRHRSQWSRPGLVRLPDVLRKLGVLAASEAAQADSPAEVLPAGFGHTWRRSGAWRRVPSAAGPPRRCDAVDQSTHKHWPAVKTGTQRPAAPGLWSLPIRTGQVPYRAAELRSVAARQDRGPQLSGS